jgi:hypothetical protein
MHSVGLIKYLINIESLWVSYEAPECILWVKRRVFVNVTPSYTRGLPGQELVKLCQRKNCTIQYEDKFDVTI